MAAAKKLKSGSWRCLVFSHYEHVHQEDGSTKKKRIYESFTSDDPSSKGKIKAESAANEFILNKDRGKRGKLTLEEAMQKYIDSKQNILSPTTVDGYKGMMKHAYSSIINAQTRSLDQEAIQIWVNEYSAGKAPKTVKNAYGFLATVLKIYEPTLVLKIKLPAPVQPDLHIPSDSEVKAFLKQIEGTELEIAVLLAAFGTLRRSEMCGLRVDDIKGNKIEIKRAMVKSGKEWIIKENPKTYAGYRTVEYPEFVIKKLMKKEGSLLSVNPDALSNRYKRAMQKSGLPRFRLHDLRHYSASIMHALKVPDQYIMERGGWETDHVMKRIYRHALPEKQKEFTDIVNNYFDSMQHEMQHEKD